MSKLYVVPTPIGNLEDITLRAIKVLKEVDLILAEDTRKSGILLKHYGISNKIQSHHVFNEHKTTEKITGKIKAGENIAIITDAGTPGISDPGFYLVRECIKENIEVECLPGATALVPSLIMSGLPADRFVFEGFLPHKKGRRSRIKQLEEETRTIILYESPHRIEKTLKQLAVQLGNERRACICREVSKIYEEVIRGKLVELAGLYEGKKVKGEIVLVIEGRN